MDRLLPSNRSLSEETEGDPRLVDIVSDEADELISALSSTTARQLLAVLNEEPRTATELADELDTTLQTVQYHLSNLREAELIEVVDIWYSDRGTEMKVYAPTTDVITLFSGERSKRRLRDYLRQILVFGIFLGAGSLAFSQIAKLDPIPIDPSTPTPVPTLPPGDPTPTPTPEPTPTSSELVDLIPILTELGVAFFFGGIAVVIGLLMYRTIRLRWLS